MATITNQATLNYTSGTSTLTASSNTASITLQEPLELSKSPLESGYKIGDTVTYNIFIKNTSPNAINNIVVVDDLGTYAISATTNVTPLTFVDPAKLFINNIHSGTVSGVVSADLDSVTFTIPSLAAGGTALLQYKTLVNEYAGAVVESSTIDNIVTATATGINTPVIATNILPVASYAQVTIEKQMSPDPVVDGSAITYTLTIRNYGNAAATNVIVQDQFDPVPTINTVTVDGTITTDHSISAQGLFRYPSTTATVNYTIPAARFTQNTTTGVVSVVPGVSTIIITGTI